ncbi:MAG: response regulator transcription factor [Burkholderiaceae bacterium]
MARSTVLRILLVDDHAVVRSGYRQLLENETRFEVVAEAGDADGAYQSFRAVSPDICIMDVMLPDASGIEASRRIIQICPSARILIFTMYSRPAIARQALAAGAMGVLSKDSPPAEMLDAVRSVANGRIYLSNTVAHALASVGISNDSHGFDALSPREFEVCHLFLRGMRVEQIARQLSISVKTVSNLLSLVRQKLNVETDIALFEKAAHAGLLDWMLKDIATTNPARPISAN